MGLEHAFQAAVAVDHTAVEIVEVGGGETAALEGNERAQIRRDDREDLEDHPFGARIALDEAFDEAEALGKLLARGLVVRGREVHFKLGAQGFQVDLLQQRAHGGRAHFGAEAVAVLGTGLVVLHAVEGFAEGKRGIAGIGHDPDFVVDDAFEFARGLFEHEADTAGHALEEPDMGHGNGEFDMAHTFAADLGMADFDAAAFADDAFVLDAFVFAAAAFPVAVRSEDLFAEEAAFFGLEAAVVDRLGVLDLAVTPGADDFGRRDFDHDRLELAQRLVGFAGVPVVRAVNHSISSPFGYLLGFSERFTVCTSRPSDWSSLSRTLKDSGRPGSRMPWPRTIDS